VHKADSGDHHFPLSYGVSATLSFRK